MGIGGYQRACSTVVEVRLTPPATVGGDGAREPVHLQIVVLGRAYLLALHAVVDVSHHIGLKPAPFLRVVVLNEANARSDDVLIVAHQLLQNQVHIVGISQVALDRPRDVVGSHLDDRHDALNLQARLAQFAFRPLLHVLADTIVREIIKDGQGQA